MRKDDTKPEVEFPKMLYYKGNPNDQRQVNSQEEEDRLGDSWVDAPSEPDVGPSRIRVDDKGKVVIKGEDGKEADPTKESETDGSVGASLRESVHAKAESNKADAVAKKDKEASPAAKSIAHESGESPLKKS